MARPIVCKVAAQVSAVLPLALIVDDDQDFRWLARRWLTRVGFDVAEAENGRAGLESLERLRPALLVLDLEMPEMGGTEVLARANARGLLARTTVIVASGADHIAVEHPCYRLPKPVAPATFLLLVQGVRDALVGAGLTGAHAANTAHATNTAHAMNTAHAAVAEGPTAARASELPSRVLEAHALSPRDDTSNDANKVAS